MITYMPVPEQESFKLLSVNPGLVLSEYSVEYDPIAREIVEVRHRADGIITFTAYNPIEFLQPLPSSTSSISLVSGSTSSVLSALSASSLAAFASSSSSSSSTASAYVADVAATVNSGSSQQPVLVSSAIARSQSPVAVINSASTSSSTLALAQMHASTITGQTGSALISATLNTTRFD